MFLALVRILAGLIVAYLIAGIVQVAFVVTPAELAGLGRNQMTEHLASAGLLALYAATHSAMFATPFALIAVAFGEWLAIRGWGYYVVIGLLIAAAGLLAQYAAETGGLTILNPYAATAFFVTGACAGMAYWLVSGRHAGRLSARRAAAAGRA